jgi:hypothetical protein
VWSSGSKKCDYYKTVIRESYFLSSGLSGALEPLQRIFDAGGKGPCPKLLKQPAMPTWREDEVSAILHTARFCVDSNAQKTTIAPSV